MKVINVAIIKNRIFGLDVLRALAIIFVVIHHGNIVYVPQVLHLNVIFKLFDFDGVSIFFVLSGFLIGGILIRIIEREAPNIAVLFDFWKRRWFRTLPNYYFVLCFLLILIPFNKIPWIENPIKGHFFITYFFFLQNFNTPMHVFFPESWSLCVEEWFYLIIPVLIFVLIGFFKMLPKRAVMFVAIFIIILVTIFRYYKYLHSNITSIAEAEYNFAYVVTTRLDSLMYGLLGAYLFFYYKAFFLKYKKTLLIVGGLILIIQKYLPMLISFDGFLAYNCILTFSLTSIGCLFLLPYMSQYRRSEGAFFRAVTYISLISYSMYLINLSPLIYSLMPMMTLVIKNVPLFSIIRYTIYWLLTVFGAVLMYKWIELPFMRLRDKISK